MLTELRFAILCLAGLAATEVSNWLATTGHGAASWAALGGAVAIWVVTTALLGRLIWRSCRRVRNCSESLQNAQPRAAK
jgi:hypothetical protein